MSAFECDKATPMCPPLRYITDEPDISTARNNRKRRTENMMRSTHVFDRNSNGSLRRIAPVRRIEHRAVPFQEPMELDAPASTRSIESIQSLESLGSTDPTPKARHSFVPPVTVDKCNVGFRCSGRKSPAQKTLWPETISSPHSVSPGPELLLSESIELDFGAPAGVKNLRQLKRSRNQIGIGSRSVDTRSIGSRSIGSRSIELHAPVLSTESSHSRAEDDVRSFVPSPITTPKHLSIDAAQREEGRFGEEEEAELGTLCPSSVETPLESSSQHFFEESLSTLNSHDHQSLLSEQFLSQACWGASE